MDFPQVTMIFHLFLLCGAALTALPLLVSAQSKCTLCYDGSPPDLSLSSQALGWSCSDLKSFADILMAGEQECLELQIVGFQDCACPTYPNGYCTLCPGGFSDIPDRSLSVPSTTNLTCGDILFVQRSLLTNGCQDLAPYRQRCGCPANAQCKFCADGSQPSNADRVLPYLTVGQQTTTCGEIAAKAFGSPADKCNDVIVPPVAVNAQGYCGCPNTFPSRLCSLCPSGIVNPDIVVPQTGGLTCSEMDTYLSYITDANSCQAIASKSQVCCENLEKCPVCTGGSSAQYNSTRTYRPYGLTCANIGDAAQYGFPLSCNDVKQRFQWYCDCPSATPSCTICQQGELPSEMRKKVPLLSTNCREINDYMSLRLTKECTAGVAGLSFDASSFCGCSGFSAPDQCKFCPDGITVRDPGLKPGLAQGASCGELEDFARYVKTAKLCAAVQNFAADCCTAPPNTPTVPPNTPTASPTTRTPANSTSSPQPTGLVPPTTPAPTGFPTLGPRPTPTNAPSSDASATFVLPTSLMFLFSTIFQIVQ